MDLRLDKITAEHLRILSEKEYRSPTQQVAYLIQQANPNPTAKDMARLFKQLSPEEQAQVLNS